MTSSRDTLRLSLIERDARSVYRLHRAHRVALDAGNLHQSTDRIAGHPGIVSDRNLRGMLDLPVRIDRKERALIQLPARCIECGEPQPVRMPHFRIRRVNLLPIENEIVGLVESDGPHPRKVDELVRANPANGDFDRVGIDRSRLFSSRLKRVARSVAWPSPRQCPHGMRAGGTDSDLV